MIESLDLSLKLSSKECRKELERLDIVLPLLQRAAHENGVPVVILFEGFDAAGKGDSIGRLVERMDPRAFKVYTTRGSSEEEALRPFLWRFWSRIPSRGNVTLFDRSWYHALMVARIEGDLDRATWERAIEDIKNFERQLTDDGTLVVKFWLHIRKQEQRRRLQAWAKDPHQAWRIQQALGNGKLRYGRLLEVAEEIVGLTSTYNAAWTLVEAEDDAYRRVKVLKVTEQALRRALEVRGVVPPTPEFPQAGPDSSRRRRRAARPDPLKELPKMPADSPLARVDLDLALPREVYERELEGLQERVRELVFAGYVERQSVVVVFEGWDAAGKGGAIKRLTQKMDPRGYSVIPVAAPQAEEAVHHYLWRFWRELPKGGHVAIFDRSWYGRVLVERVEGFCPDASWRRAYQEINEFERELVGDGISMVKFWLHISPDEQLRRFRQREKLPAKWHKIGDEDWRNRAKWPHYLEAVSDMLRETSTAHAPWTVVEADCKLHARIKVLKTVIRAMVR